MTHTSAPPTATSPSKARGTALYRLFDNDGHLLYVGISDDPLARWMSHRASKDWWHEVARFDLEWRQSRDEALAVELQAIKTENPKYNLAGTQEYNDLQASRQRQNASTQRVKCRVAYEASNVGRSVRSRLLSEGMSPEEASKEGRLAERAYKEASGAFPNGVVYPRP